MSGCQCFACCQMQCACPDADWTTELERTQAERIKALEAALFNTVTELESWNLTEGDLESVVVIKAAKDALRAAGKLE